MRFSKKDHRSVVYQFNLKTTAVTNHFVTEQESFNVTVTVWTVTAKRKSKLRYYLQISHFLKT